MTSHNGLVLHVQVGNGSCYNEFANPANQASSTWWVSKGGVIEQYVDSDLIAWTEAAGNPYWNSVETEGTPDQPLTNPQVQSLARIYAWGAQTYHWPLALTDDPNGRGFGWHGMGGAAWGGHYGCPGEIRKSQRSTVLYLANLVLNPTPTPPPPPPPPPIPKELSMFATDPITGGVWSTDETGALYALYGAPYISGLNAHPQWGAGTPTNPCVGIAYWGKPGADGVVFFTKPSNGKGGIAGTPYSAYRFNRNGTTA